MTENKKTEGDEEVAPELAYGFWAILEVLARSLRTNPLRSPCIRSAIWGGV